MTRTMTMMTGTGDLAHLSPRQDEMTHLWEAKASRRNHTELSRLQRIIVMVFIVMNIETKPSILCVTHKMGRKKRNYSVG